MNPVITKAQTIDAAWTQIAAAIVFGSVARDTGYEVSIQNALDAEAALEESRASVTAKQVDRDEKVAILQSQTKLVANGVRGSSDFGPDSDLYGAMGFVRDSARKSGLTQKRTPATPAAPAQP